MQKLILLLIVLIIGASTYLSSCKKEDSPDANYNTYCGSCHELPNPANIPQSIWRNKVLPEMAARMGYRYNGFNPYNNSLEENHYVKTNNVYPEFPIFDTLKWKQLHDYILSQSPDTIINYPNRIGRNSTLEQFTSSLHKLDQDKQSGGLTNISFDTVTNRLLLSNVYGNVYEWENLPPFAGSFNSPIISSIIDDNSHYLTEIGIMNPSEIPRGTIYKLDSGTLNPVFSNLHRPVFTLVDDLNEDGKNEILICEFGHHTGEFSMLVEGEEGYEKETLIPLPGSINAEVVDMNQDGKKDIVVLLAQGKEGIYILYQENDLEFTIDYVIKMGPEYGTSWFELIDYNGDGYKDIVIVNGDNADYSNFLKPYHGIRLFLNSGSNQFEEKWFYPINGATRVLTADFDFDGDQDFAVISFFPDFKQNPEEGFVYLENIDADNYTFKSYTSEMAGKGNWLVMEKGDIDTDGDLDIILGNFSMIAPQGSGIDPNADVLLLENTAIK